jgi:hypothetical protein
VRDGTDERPVGPVEIEKLRKKNFFLADNVKKHSFSEKCQEIKNLKSIFERNKENKTDKKT